MSEILLDMEKDSNKLYINFLKTKFLSFYTDKKKDVKFAKLLLKRKLASEILEISKIYGDELSIENDSDDIILRSCFYALFNFEDGNILYDEFIKKKKTLNAIEDFFKNKKYEVTYDDLDDNIEELKPFFKDELKNLKLFLFFLLADTTEKFFALMIKNAFRDKKIKENNDKDDFKLKYSIYQKIKRVTPDAQHQMHLAYDDSIRELISRKSDLIYLETIKNAIEQNNKFRLNFFSKLFFIVSAIAREKFFSKKEVFNLSNLDANENFSRKWFSESKIFINSIIIAELLNELSKNLIKKIIIRIKEKIKPIAEKIIAKLNFYLTKTNF